MDLITFYQTNEDFREYLDKYCDKHNVSVETAVNHLVVRYVAKEYKDIEDARQNIKA